MNQLKANRLGLVTSSVALLLSILLLIMNTQAISYALTSVLAIVVVAQIFIDRKLSAKAREQKLRKSSTTQPTKDPLRSSLRKYSVAMIGTLIIIGAIESLTVLIDHGMSILTILVGAIAAAFILGFVSYLREKCKQYP